MANYDEDDFNDFLSKVDDINKTIQGLQDGTVDVNKLDKEEQRIRKAEEAKEARKAQKQAEERAKIQAKIDERKRLDELKEENREKLQELKEEYYLRKARREKWLEFRETNRSRAFSDYYKGWDLFEEDPDEELFGDPDKPAAVQDQSAFDAMAKDIEERTAQRKGMQAACAKERESANLAFKAGQYSEALAGYTRAVEHFKGDKTSLANRAAAHLKLRNFLSALDDCSRVIEIATWLDNDVNVRPPPPPLLKAYVRRAAAQSELGRYTEAGEDLATALEMAPEAEKPEIKRQQRILKEDMAAAKREAALETAPSKGGAAAAAAEGAEGGAHLRELRTRVRELLETLQTESSAAAATLDSLLAAADRLDAADAAGDATVASSAAGEELLGAEAGGPPTVTDPRVRLANLAVARSKSQAAAATALSELTGLARDTAAARVCLRHAGGVKLLLSLMSAACHRSHALTQAAAAAAGAKGGSGPPKAKKGGGAKAVGDLRRIGREEAAAEGFGWATSLAKLLVVAALERRNQLEFHTCNGPTQIWRELRKVVTPCGCGSAGDRAEAGTAAVDVSPSAAATAAADAMLAALAPQLRLLALCCDHETVASEARRLAAGEAAPERLLVLLQPTAKAAAFAGTPPRELPVAAAALIGALCAGGPKAKVEFLPLAKPLCVALGAHVALRDVPLAEQAATALGSLSAHSKFRRAIVDGPALHNLLDFVRMLPGDAASAGVPGGAAAWRSEVLMPNVLAALHNCTLDADAIGFVTSEEVALIVLSWLEAAFAAAAAGPPPVLARRAAAVLAKCATRHAAVVEKVLGSAVLGALVRALVDEGKAVEAAENAPRIVDITPGTDAQAEAEAADEEAESAAAEEEMVGSALRILTACAAQAQGAHALCEGGGLPALVRLLQRPDAALQGNAALCIAECAKDERCLAVLAVQPLVPPLLAICHNGNGGPQKNAAIALGRLAKNPRLLLAIKENHGIEILARAMKGKVSGL